MTYMLNGMQYPVLAISGGNSPASYWLARRLSRRISNGFVGVLIN